MTIHNFNIHSLIFKVNIILFGVDYLFSVYIKVFRNNINNTNIKTAKI